MIFNFFLSYENLIADLNKLHITSIWKYCNSLGSGSFGEVFKYQHLPTDKFFAVKKVKFNPDTKGVTENMKNLQVEIVQYSKFKENSLKGKERIVEYFGSVIDENKFFNYICLEYMQRGSLRAYLESNGNLDENKTRKYTRQVLEGLCYLHRIRIVHRDIKGGNILLTENDDIKLVDFGASKYLESSTHGANTQKIGTNHWMPPEIVKGEKYGFKADIWSTGCTVVEMLTTKPPWPQLRHFQVPDKLKGLKNNELPDFELTSPSNEVKQFLKLCFLIQHNDRPSAEELLTDKFVNI